MKYQSLRCCKSAIRQCRSWNWELPNTPEVTAEMGFPSKTKPGSFVGSSAELSRDQDRDGSMSISTQLNSTPADLLSNPSNSDRAEISKKLLALGSASLSTFSNPATDYDAFQPPTLPSTHVEEDVELQEDEEIIQGLNSTSAHQLQYASVAKLNRAAQRAFGSSVHHLNYDFLEDQGPRRKKCILTITKPDGQKRIYTTEPVFARKGEAKAKVATIAIQHDALLFIAGGDPGTNSLHNLRLVNAPDKERGKKHTDPAAAAAVDGSSGLVVPAVDEIDKCCKEWRADHVRPDFVRTTDPKTGLHGCALRIALTPHLKKVFSVRTAHQDDEDAKAAVAKEAVAQGILEFIKHGDGQQEPMPSAAEYAPPEYLMEGPDDPSFPATRQASDRVAKENEMTKIQTINTFWDALPKPLPAPGVGVGSGDLVDPKSWVNQMLQQNKGCQLTLTFSWSMHPRSGLHGCVLRLDHPSLPSRSYMVDAVFSKRQEAKTAVCLQAISEDVGEYIRSTGIKYNESLTKDMKEQATKLYTVITQDLSRTKPSQRAEWEFICENQVFGCNLTVPIPMENGVSKRTYRTKMEYRSRGDAKAAVALMAVNQGVLELIRFRGKSPPADYNRDTFDWRVHMTKKAAEAVEAKRAADAAARVIAEEKKRQAIAERQAALEELRRQNLELEAKQKMLQKRKRELEDVALESLEHQKPPLSDAGVVDGHGGENPFKRPRQNFDSSRMSVDPEFRGRIPPQYPASWKGKFAQAQSSQPVLGRHQRLGFDPQAMRRGLDDPYGPTPYSRPSDRDVSQEGYAWTPDQHIPRGPSSQRLARPQFPYRGGGRFQNWGVKGRDELGRDFNRSAVHPMIAESRSNPATVSLMKNHHTFVNPGLERRQPNHPPYQNHFAPMSGFAKHPYHSQPKLQRTLQPSGAERPLSEQEILDELYAAYPPPPHEPSQHSNVPDQGPRTYLDLDAAPSGDSYHDDSLYGSPGSTSNHNNRFKSGVVSAAGSSSLDANPTAYASDRTRAHLGAFEFDDDSIPFSSSAGPPMEAVQEPSVTSVTVQVDVSESTQPSDKSYLKQLFELCKEAGKPRPVFHSNAVNTGRSVEYSIWIVMGKERLELPVTFPDLKTGQEKLSKQVVAHLHRTLKKDV
ncbi:uncharacterized protein EI90DRAFT_300196 [Cantharellus anzutake]|uniref:uncharacterized protein n=1 Tax=Cantharellus anzutake TaxID=1750568 RepID=UPI0019059EC6|nr:uncharacterized protein EI90DRAFT_300196 [Cantharellus anzutake]KAF8315797.1 hypothetical protein EI90DRAFT_300196 [Cantharellus anzutake]